MRHSSLSSSLSFSLSSSLFSSLFTSLSSSYFSSSFSSFSTSSFSSSSSSFSSSSSSYSIFFILPRDEWKETKEKENNTPKRNKKINSRGTRERFPLLSIGCSPRLCLVMTVTSLFWLLFQLPSLQSLVFPSFPFGFQLRIIFYKCAALPKIIHSGPYLPFRFGSASSWRHRFVVADSAHSHAVFRAEQF